MTKTKLCIPRCEIEFTPSHDDGFCIVLKIKENKKVESLVAVCPLAKKAEGAWIFPMTQAARLFLLSLPGAHVVSLQESDGLSEEAENYTHVLYNGRVHRLYDNGRIKRENTMLPGTLKRLEALLVLRGIAAELLTADQAGSTKSRALRRELNAAYDEFVKTYGKINSDVNRSLLHDDLQAGMLFLLEQDGQDGESIKSPFFQSPLVSQRQTSEKNFEAALSDIVPLTTDALASRMGMLPDEAAQRLRTAGWFETPRGEWQRPAEYLSGDIRGKLEEINQAPATKYRRNQEALRRALPVPPKFEDIECALGMPWIGEDIHRKFVAKLFERQLHSCDKFVISYVPVLGKWEIVLPETCKQTVPSVMAVSGSNDPRLRFGRLFSDTMQNRMTMISRRDDNGNLLPDNAAMDMAEKMKERLNSAFRKYILDENLGDEIVRRYLAVFPPVTTPAWDGSTMSFPGMANEIFSRLYPHQRNAVRRALMTRYCYLGHDVGTGKTLIEITFMMEIRRLRLVERSLYTVPNNLLEQTYQEIYRAYPSAKVFVLESEDISENHIQRLKKKLGKREMDIILTTHEAFARLGVPVDFARASRERLVREQRSLLKFDQISGATAKEWERKEAKLKAKPFRKPLLTVKDLNVQCIVVDEAQAYKNLSADYSTAGESAATGSERAEVLSEISQYMHATGGRILLASGTPLSNKGFELYTLQRYLQPDLMKKCQIFSAGDWIRVFMAPCRNVEPSPDGNGVIHKVRYRYVNAKALFKIFSLVYDAVRIGNCPYISRPVTSIFNIVVEPSPEQVKFIQNLSRRAVDGEMPLTLLMEGRLASLCPTLLRDRAFPLPEEGKIQVCADKVADLYHRYRSFKAAQLIFADLGTPKSTDGRLYAIVKEQLILRGIPAHEIGFVHDMKSRLQKEHFFSAIRNGRIRVGIGSTQTLGEGANVQDRLIAVHNLDCPWRSKDFKQRLGRITRSGNKFAEVAVYNYSTKGTLDPFLWGTVEAKLRTFEKDFYQDDTLDLFSISCEDILHATSASPAYIELRKLEKDIDNVKQSLLESATFLPQTLSPPDILTCRDQIKKKIEALSSLVPTGEPRWIVPVRPRISKGASSVENKIFPPEDWLACRRLVQSLLCHSTFIVKLFLDKFPVHVYQMESREGRLYWTLDCGGGHYIEGSQLEILMAVQQPDLSKKRYIESLAEFEVAVAHGKSFTPETGHLQRELEELEASRTAIMVDADRNESVRCRP